MTPPAPILPAAPVTPAPFLPLSRVEMDALGWAQCDVILITGDAYVDHPSFGMALIGRLLEAHGWRVGIISQPDWHSADAFRTLGRPRLYFGITAGNMDSMVNHYTSERKIRSDDAYTAGGIAGRRPDRAATVYAQRAREAWPGITVVLGSIEASLRRIAHYDYWSDKVRRSILADAKADLLIFGNAERALLDLTRRLDAGEAVADIRDLRGAAFMTRPDWRPVEWTEIDASVPASAVPQPAVPDPHRDPYSEERDKAPCATPPTAPLDGPVRITRQRARRERVVIRLPSYEAVKDDPILYAHASRVFHLESNPGNARALVQRHGEGPGARDVWLNPPPVPLTTTEMDFVYGLPYARRPHPAYGEARIPAWDMIRFSVNIMRGCFGGCTFCSITEHEGRIIQSRSQASILREIGEIRARTLDFRGHITDLGGPTANMYRMACRDKAIEAACRRLSCVYPGICAKLVTDHAPLIALYRAARAVPGVKRITIGSGLRYDLAVRSPEYVRELVSHHVSGLLKIAAHHDRDGFRLWPALRPPPPSGLRRSAHSGVGHDPFLGQHHAWLLRRLYLLLDHRTRRPHHPEPFAGVNFARDRRNSCSYPGFSRPYHRSWRPDCQHVPHGLPRQGDRSRLPPPLLCLPRHLRQARHRSRAPDRAIPRRPRRAGGQAHHHRFRLALRPRRALARIRARTRQPSRFGSAQDRP
ncbi:hypothetical protein AGMMS49543_20090 [Betaproteobacteria bacterium]|nr:hypothetical protein AGMMS49543_20090 [Betaproteobacteria bacterium]